MQILRYFPLVVHVQASRILDARAEKAGFTRLLHHVVSCAVQGLSERLSTSFNPTFRISDIVVGSCH